MRTEGKLPLIATTMTDGIIPRVFQPPFGQPWRDRPLTLIVFAATRIGLGVLTQVIINCSGISLSTPEEALRRRS